MSNDETKTAVSATAKKPEADGERIFCRSVFRSGKGTTKEAFTAVWAEMVNRAEKNKAVPMG